MATETSAPEDGALDASVNGLRRDSPVFSAAVTATGRQRVTLLLVVAVLVGLLIRYPTGTLVAAISGAMIVYLVTLADRLYLFVLGLNNKPAMRVSDEEALALSDDELPVYTVLLPAFKEHDIVHDLLRGVGQLDYPKDKLDIRLLLEADDTDTISAAAESEAAELVEIVLVPAAEPRTKPKACNYGLVDARGELVTIYDAEDIPDPLQLRRVVAAFRKVPTDVACIQAMLKYHNVRQNLLTRWFASEYDQWFGYTLPGLMKDASPIPLGGTSNHMRMETLAEVGGWDPFNVTEDADVGIRLARLGYSTAVLDSVTYEEANSDPINWIRQRSRWYKGYLQTFLVHTRHPVQLWRQLGTRGVFRFAGLTAGTPAVTLINSVFWLLTLAWLFAQPTFIRNLFPPFAYYAALVSLLLGNAAIVYMGVVAARADRKPQLAGASLLAPLYWILMAIAAVKAFVQLVFYPSYWEKTHHGLHLRRRHLPESTPP